MSDHHSTSTLPLPPHYNPARVGEVWQVPYQRLSEAARNWASLKKIRPAASDKVKISLMLVDVQNTFCIPGFELYVGGRSGTGAVDDNRRLVEFIYRNLSSITQITATLDTHQAIQIFHAIYLINKKDEHPAPMTMVSIEDVQRGVWKFNPAVAASLGIHPEDGQRRLEHYVNQLHKRGKYELTIWPYHAMIGGIGHALVSSVEEALFFHTIARSSQLDLTIKGQHPFTESYSAIGPEVLAGPAGEPIGQKNAKFLQKLKEADVLVIAGQAKSHCVAWTVDDLLTEIQARDASLAGKIYLLEDCTSPVVVPGVVDYTEQADVAFQKFAQAGMHTVKSTELTF